MICPHCHNELLPEVSACPHCGGAVAAQSLPLWSDTGVDPIGRPEAADATSIKVKRYDDEEEEEPPPGAPAGWVAGDNAAVFTSAAEREENTEKKRPVFGPSDERAINTQLVSSDPQQAQHTRIVEVSLPPAVKRVMRDRADSGGEGSDGDDGEQTLFEQLAREMRHFYQRLHRIDRYAVWTLLVTLIATFAPWFFESGVGLSSGVEGVGAVSCAATLGAIGTIYLRTNRRRLSGTLIMVQFLLVVAVAAPPLFYLFVGTHQLVVGAYAALAGAAVAVVLTLARLTRLNV